MVTPDESFSTDVFDKALERAKSDAIIELHRRLDDMRAQRDKIWNDAIEAAARIADEWDHHGDPAIAMYASPQIRDRILKLKTAIKLAEGG